MLEIKKISKRYQTGDLVQTALDEVSLTFRDSEFVSILGPSGSGKTTLLNIIGGLDRYDSGDLVIADKNGNIIFRSNGDGFETVNLIVQNITINGKIIQEMIQEYVNEAILGGVW